MKTVPLKYKLIALLLGAIFVVTSMGKINSHTYTTGAGVCNAKQAGFNCFPNAAEHECRSHLNL